VVFLFRSGRSDPELEPAKRKLKHLSRKVDQCRSESELDELEHEIEQVGREIEQILHEREIQEQILREREIERQKHEEEQLKHEIEQLKNELERYQLLRGASAPIHGGDVLLRPAASNEPSDPDQLLRPSIEED
jgi:predicted RNase H-like nuclease (RuvC/YqgF family)